MHTVIIHNGIAYRAFSHLYAVSACGKFLKVGTLRPYEPKKRLDGYLSVGRQKLAHRMVAACWLSKPVHATHVHHRNGDKTDNRAENLEWVTPKEHFGDRHKDTIGRHKKSDATREKLRALRLGRKLSDDTKQKQREANLRLGVRPPSRPLGYKCSDEAIAKMRQNSPNARGCEIDGVYYSSFSEAGRALGAKPHTLRKRCLADSFANYRLAEGR